MYNFKYYIYCVYKRPYCHQDRALRNCIYFVKERPEDMIFRKKMLLCNSIYYMYEYDSGAISIERKVERKEFKIKIYLMYYPRLDKYKFSLDNNIEAIIIMDKDRVTSISLLNNYVIQF